MCTQASVTTYVDATILLACIFGITVRSVGFCWLCNFHLRKLNGQNHAQSQAEGLGPGPRAPFCNRHIVCYHLVCSVCMAVRSEVQGLSRLLAPFIDRGFSFHGWTRPEGGWSWNARHRSAYPRPINYEQGVTLDCFMLLGRLFGCRCPARFAQLRTFVLSAEIPCQGLSSIDYRSAPMTMLPRGARILLLVATLSAAMLICAYAEFDPAFTAFDPATGRRWRTPVAGPFENNVRNGDGFRAPFIFFAFILQ